MTAVSGNTITVDIPIVDTIETRYGGGVVYRVDATGRVSQVGVEDLRLVSEYSGNTDEDHGWTAVELSNATNSWVRRVTAQYFGYAAVRISSDSAFNTVEECAMLDPISVVTGGRRYSFNVNDGTGNLFQRCYSEEARHDFVSGSRTTGPNVWLDCYSRASSTDDGPHHRWATGLLFDNTASYQLNVQNREDSGTGHGWAGAQTLFWNAIARSIICDAPLGAMNWAIGCTAERLESSRDPGAADGWWESERRPVAPRSLYLQQLQDRLGPAAVVAVTTPAQRAGRIWGQLANWRGEGALASHSTDRGDPACASGVPSGLSCCEAGCGTCGGPGCSGRPGGASGCCTGHVSESGRSCQVVGAPCMLDPTFPPVGE